MSCDMTPESIEDEYSTPDGMTDSDVELLEQEVNLARARAMRAAEAAGAGPNAVEMAGHKAALQAKKEAHDRFHLQEIRQRAEAGDGAEEAIPVPVLAAREKERSGAG